MNCQTHSNELYSNFCTNTTCMQALCPECIDTHIQMHKIENTHSQICSLSSVRNGCLTKIKTAIKQLDQQIGLAQIHSNKQTCMDFIGRQLIRCKDQLMVLIEQRIQQVLNSIEPIMFKKQKFIEDSNQVVQELTSLQKELHQNNESSIENIIKTCQLDLKSLIDNFQSQIDAEIGDQESVVINSDYLDELVVVLQKVIIKGQSNIQLLSMVDESKQEQHHHHHHELPQQQLKVSPIQQSPIFNHALELPSPIKSVDKFYTPLKKPKLIQKIDNLNINVPNFYSIKCKQQIIPFFKPDDKLLYLVDLKANVQQIQLRIDFTIPKYHKSIITQHGDIYMLGGVDSQTGKRISSVYCFEPINRKLVFCGALQTSRSSFGILYLYPYIYCISGLVPQLTNSCERYNIMTNKSELIADCLFMANSPAVISFNQKIYKFSQFEGIPRIEHYSDKQWIAINAKFDGQFKQCSTGAQVNANQFIIFGGYDDTDVSYDECFICTHDGNMTFTEINSLPFAEGFWNPQVIAMNNSIYAMQNVELPHIKDVDDSRRRLVKFTATGWD